MIWRWLKRDWWILLIAFILGIISKIIWPCVIEIAGICF